MLGGVHVGYNAQWNRLVFGLEADLSASGYKSVQTSNFTTPIAGPGYHELRQEMPWMATLRPRIGYSFGKVLVYATGGLALVKSKVTENTVIPPGSSFSEPDRFSTATINSAWTVGGGIEYALSKGWAVRGEYLHVGLRQSGSSFAKSPYQGNNSEIPYSHKFSNQINIMRLGISYRF